MFVHRSTLYFLPWSSNWDTIGKNLLPSCNGKQTIGGCTEGNSLHEKGLIKLNDFSWPPDDGGHSRRWHFSGGLTCIKQRGFNGISENSQETAKEMPFHRIGAGVTGFSIGRRGKETRSLGVWKQWRVTAFEGGTRFGVKEESTRTRLRGCATTWGCCYPLPPLHTAAFDT